VTQLEQLMTQLRARLGRLMDMRRESNERFNPPRTFVEGPDNWARVQVRKLAAPDSAGNTHRVTLALDSQIAPHATSLLSPVENDILNGTRFSLAWRDEEVADFLDQTWIDGWLREAFSHYASGVENRADRDLQLAMRNFEYQAHWLNLLAMLGEQLTVPEVKFVTHTLSTPAIPVDLILDVGNTHTCGVIIEDHGDANDGLRQTAELQVRSLSEPQFLNEPLFTSRLEFSEARFGKQHFSVESGREDAFVWPSIVRVGDEARKLATQRLGTEGNSGISSPRRYLWVPEISFRRCSRAAAASGNKHQQQDTRQALHHALQRLLHHSRKRPSATH
jgi:hypothetical protein